MANNQFTNVNIATLKKGTAVFAYTGTTIDKALAGDNTKLPFLGLLFADTANNAVGSPQRGGDFSATIAEWDYVLETPTGTGLTTNTEYWLSDNVAGKITPVKPTVSANQIRVGYSISTTQLSIDFRNINSSGDEVNSRIDSINTQLTASSQNVTGFENLTDSKMSFNNTTRVFTIEPNTPVTEYNIYRNAIKTTINTAKTITLPNTTNEYFIYFDSNNNLAYLTIFDPSLIFEYVYVAIIHYNASQAKMITDKPADERHGISMSSATHYYAHKTIGAKWIEGLGLTGFTIDGDGSLDSHSQFTAESGSFADEDIVHEVPSYSQLAVFFRDGTEWKSKTADAFPFIFNGQEDYTGTRICFNENVTGNYQLTEVTNDYYILLHPYALNSKQVAVFLGVNQYATLEEARAGANVELSTFNGLPFQEFVKIGSVIVKCSNSFTNTHKVATVSTDLGQNYVDFRRSSTLSIINAGSDHVHSQYLTEAQANTLYSVVGHSHVNISGNAATATALQTARTINGVSFDGTSNITITAAAANHASTHANGGADEIEIDASQVTSGTFAIDKIAALVKGSIITSNGTVNVEKAVDPIALKILCSNPNTSDGLDYKHLSELYNLSEYQVPLLDEFVGTTTGMALGWSSQVSGTGAGMNFNTALNTQDHPGVIDIFTGTTTAGRTIYSTGFWSFSGGLHGKYFGELIYINALSTNGQRYTKWIGFQDNYNIATEFGVGACFKYSDNINGGNWQLMTCQVTRTTYNPLVPVPVAVGWVYLSMLFNSTNTSVQFYINGVAYGDPITTNLPTGNCGLSNKIIKSSGTTTRYFSVDLAICTAKLPNGRLGQNISHG